LWNKKEENHNQIYLFIEYRRTISQEYRRKQSIEVLNITS